VVLYSALSAIAGLGAGLVYPAAAAFVVDLLPVTQLSIGTSILGIAISLGTAAATAATTAVLQHHPVIAHINAGGQTTTRPIPQVFSDSGYAIGFWIVVAATVIALLIALFLRQRSTAPSNSPPPAGPQSFPPQHLTPPQQFAGVQQFAPAQHFSQPNPQFGPPPPFR
jgi:MFS family permease